MSCQDCNDLQESTVTSYFRWGTANIEVRACSRHLKEVYAALRAAVSKEERLRRWHKEALKSQGKL